VGWPKGVSQRPGPRGPMKKKILSCEECSAIFERAGTHKVAGKIRCTPCKEKYYLTAYPTRYHADRMRLRVYNITADQYNALHAIQNGCCGICKKHSSEFPKALCVDHCHTTGKVRGLLCDKCNRLIGLANDSDEILCYAINYVQYPPAVIIGRPKVNQDIIARERGARLKKAVSVAA
jgi:hypothetical protein